MKKILAIILSFVIVLSSSAVQVCAAKEEKTFSDRQIELIETLGIMTQSYADKYYSKEMNRGEFAYYVAKFAQISSVKPSGFEALYRDVTSEHTYFGAIKALKDAGYMNGYTDGSFGPEDSISTADAAKVVLYTIGYKPYINAVGKNAALNKSGVLSGIELKDTLEVQDLVMLFYNALHTSALRMVSVDGDGANYDFSSSYLGIEHLYKIIYRKGVVNGTQGTRLTAPDSSITNDEIMIESVRYKYFANNASEFLGYNVEFYYKDLGNGVKTIIYISKADSNKELVLNSADIIALNGFTYSYYSGNSTKTVNITRDTDILYNGVAYPACRDTEAVPNFGNVVLIDNNGDRVYDVLKIENYEFLLVNNVDAKKKVFSDMKEGVSFDFSNADELNITWDGDVYPIERIIKGDFLLIKRTISTSGFYQVNIDVRKDERSFTEIQNFNLKKNTFKGGGTDYKLWDKLDADSKRNMVIGKWVTLYFCNGIIVRIEKGEGGGAKFGYLMAADKEGTFDEKIRFQLADDAGNVAIYNMGKVVYIDGTIHKNWAAIDSKLRTTATLTPHYNAAYPYAQVVKYELSGKGDLLKLDTQYNDAAKEDPETALRLDASSTASATFMMRNQNTTMYNGDTLIASVAKTTVKVKVPEDNRTNTEGYGKLTWADGEAMNVEVYNIDDNIYIPQAVFGFSAETATSPIGGRTKPVIVKAKEISLNAEGDTIAVLTVLDQKNEYVYTSDTKLVDTIDVGDMIRVELKDTNVIKKAECIYDVSNAVISGGGNWFDLDTTDSYSSLRPFTMGTKLIHGTAVYAKDGFLRMASVLPKNFDPTDNSKIDNLDCTNSKFFKCSMVRGEPVVETATLTDVSGYVLSPANPSELVVVIYSNASLYVYIIEK